MSESFDKPRKLDNPEMRRASKSSSSKTFRPLENGGNASTVLEGPLKAASDAAKRIFKGQNATEYIEEHLKTGDLTLEKVLKSFDGFRGLKREKFVATLSHATTALYGILREVTK